MLLLQQPTKLSTLLQKLLTTLLTLLQKPLMKLLTRQRKKPRSNGFASFGNDWAAPKGAALLIRAQNLE